MLPFLYKYLLAVGWQCHMKHSKNPQIGGPRTNNRIYKISRSTENKGQSPQRISSVFNFWIEGKQSTDANWTVLSTENHAVLQSSHGLLATVSGQNYLQKMEVMHACRTFSILRHGDFSFETTSPPLIHLALEWKVVVRGEGSSRNFQCQRNGETFKRPGQFVCNY